MVVKFLQVFIESINWVWWPNNSRDALIVNSVRWSEWIKMITIKLKGRKNLILPLSLAIVLRKFLMTLIAVYCLIIVCLITWHIRMSLWGKYTRFFVSNLSWGEIWRDCVMPLSLHESYNLFTFCTFFYAACICTLTDIISY